MKKFILPIFALCAFMFTSCDYVEFPNQDDGPITTTNGDSAVQKVMIEEFTGQGCGNCPGGALIAEQLRNAYGDRLVVVSIHSGWFANGGNQYGPNDMNCTEGEDIDAAFGISNIGNPNGMVNRKENSGNVVVGPNGWGPMVGDIINNQTPAVNIDVTASFDSGSGNITADINVDFLENLTGDYNIVAAVTENNITAPQANYTGTGDPAYPTPEALNYVHKHVLRDHFNGTWGTPLVAGTASAGDTENVNLSIAKGTSWDSGELSVVVYVYDVATNEVVQVEEVHVN